MYVINCVTITLYMHVNCMCSTSMASVSSTVSSHDVCMVLCLFVQLIFQFLSSQPQQFQAGQLTSCIIYPVRGR
jgi:hypothetical protein